MKKKAKKRELRWAWKLASGRIECGWNTTYAFGKRPTAIATREWTHVFGPGRWVRVEMVEVKARSK